MQAFPLPGDLAKTAEAQVADLLADWLEDRGLPPDLGPARDFAQTVVAALNGLKSSAKTIKDLRAGEARLGALIARSLKAKS